MANKIDQSNDEMITLLFDFRNKFLEINKDKDKEERRNDIIRSAAAKCVIEVEKAFEQAEKEGLI